MNPALVAGLITVGKLDALKKHLDRYPEDLRAWTRESWMTLAAQVGNMEILKELAVRGLHPNEPAADGRSSTLAAAVEYPEVVDWLLELSADATVPRVMVSAASRASPDTVRKLLAAGGDATVRSGNPPRNGYEQALMMGRTDVAAMMKPRNPNFDLPAWLREQLGELRPAPTDLVPPGAPFSLMLADLPDGDAVGSECTICTTLGLSLRELPGLKYRAEAFVRLPGGWPVTTELGGDPKWPVDWLLSVLRAATTGPVLKMWDTVGNGEPPQRLSPDLPYVGTLNVAEYQPRGIYDADGNEIRLLSLLPLHPAELKQARKDMKPLIEALGQGGLLGAQGRLGGPVITRERPSVIGKKLAKR